MQRQVLFSSLHVFLVLLQAMRGSCGPRLVVATRDPASIHVNLLFMGCRDELDDEGFIEDAVFFRNKEKLFDLSHPVTRDPSRIVEEISVYENQIVFSLDLNSEGNYSCGEILHRNTIISPELEIVALPSISLPPPSPPIPTTVFAPRGSQARLRCPHQPGFLIEYYSIIWINASSDYALATIPRVQGAVIPGYSVDESTLDLLIDEVDLLDSHTEYQCLLNVHDPQNYLRLHRYPTSESIELIVYEAPVIVTSPTSTVVSTADMADSVNFTCHAEGSTHPIITWMHRGQKVTQSDKYLISYERYFTRSGRQGNASVLTVQNYLAEDTAMIECHADTTSTAETGNQSLPGDNVTVPFSVLVVADSLTVFITTSGDVIFSLTFPTTPLHPVQLRLHYQEVGGDSNTEVVTTSTRFTETADISYIAYSATVPFKRFRVNVSLVHEGVEGPARPAPNQYDTSQPTDLAAILSEAVTPSVLVPCLVSISLLVALTIFFCFLYHRKRPSAQDRIVDAELKIKESSHKANIKCKKRRQDKVEDYLDSFQARLEKGELSEAVQLRFLDMVGQYATTVSSPPPSYMSRDITPNSSDSSPEASVEVREEKSLIPSKSEYVPKTRAAEASPLQSPTDPTKRPVVPDSGDVRTPSDPSDRACGHLAGNPAEYTSCVSQKVMDRLAEVTQMLVVTNDKMRQVRTSVRATVAVNKFKSGISNDDSKQLLA